MGAWLDMAGALVFAVALSALVSGLTADASREVHVAGMTYEAQLSAGTVADVMGADLRRMGLAAAGPALATADSAAIEFQADLDDDAVVETVRYHLGATTDAVGTPNPSDRTLVRTVNGVVEHIPLGLTGFRVRYYDDRGDALSAPVPASQVRQIEVDLSIASTVGYDSAYAKTVRTFRVRPKNLGL